MALRKIDLMHRTFGICDGHTCGECSNLVSYSYNDRITLSISQGKIADNLISHGVTVRERGRWEKIAHYPYYCSICGEIAPLDFERESHYKSNFCPNCGADMR